MIHLNGHKLCVIDCETTGLKPRHHDLIQVCFMPLNFALEPDGTPFELKLKPHFYGEADPKAMSVNKKTLVEIMRTGMEQTIAADLFDEWFDRIGLGQGKRLVPLAHNWVFDKEFISEWLGPENFNYRIDGRYRDTMGLSLSLNDAATFHAESYPFPKNSLAYLANQLEVEWDTESAHDALYDCVKTAEIYRKMIGRITYL